MRYMQANFDISGDGPVQTRLVTRLADLESLTLKPTQVFESAKLIDASFPTETLQNTFHLLTDTRPYSSYMTVLPSASSFSYNNPQSRPTQLDTASTLKGFQPSQTPQQAVSSPVVAATQAAVTSGGKNLNSGGFSNSGLVIGTIVGGVLGLFTCIILVYCVLSTSVRARRKHRQLWLSDEITQKGSDIVVSRAGSELDKLYDRELDESVPHAQAPASFDPSPFQAENLISISHMGASLKESGAVYEGIPVQPPPARHSQEARNNPIRGQFAQFYQIKPRPEIKPARLAPLPPQLRIRIETDPIPQSASRSDINAEVSNLSARLAENRYSMTSSIYSPYEPKESHRPNEPEGRPEIDALSPYESVPYDDGCGDFPVLLYVDENPKVAGNTDSSRHLKNLAHAGNTNENRWIDHTISQRARKRRAEVDANPSQTLFGHQGSGNQHNNDDDFVLDDYSAIIDGLEKVPL